MITREDTLMIRGEGTLMIRGEGTLMITREDTLMITILLNCKDPMRACVFISSPTRWHLIFTLVSDF